MHDEAYFDWAIRNKLLHDTLVGSEHLSRALLARIPLEGKGGVCTAELAGPVDTNARSLGLSLVIDHAFSG